MSSLKNIQIVLVRAENPINIGQAARSMKNFGCSNLSLVNCAAHQTPEAYTVGWKAKKILDSATIFKNLPKALKGCELCIGFTTRARNKRNIPVPFSQILPQILETMKTQKVHLIFGNEKNGLSNEELNSCHILATLPANPIYPSLNLSHAVAITLAQIFSNVFESKKLFKNRARFFANRQELKTLMNNFSEVFYLLKYDLSMNKDLLPTVQRQLKNFFLKSSLERREHHLFIALLYKIKAALNKKEQHQ